MIYIIPFLSFLLGMIVMWVFYFKKYRCTFSKRVLNKQLDVALKAGDTSVWGLDLKTNEVYNIKGHLIEKPRMLLSELLPYFYSDKDIKRFQQAIDDVVSEKVDIAELTILYKSYVTGKYEYIRKGITGIKNKKGKIISLVGTHKNITKQVQINKKLHEAKLKAEESDQFKMLFLASMSHEIRTPLNAIVGFSSLLNEVENKEERASYVDIINSNSELLLTLVNDILDLSKIENGDIQIDRHQVDMVHDMKNFESVTKKLATNQKKNLKIEVIHPYKELVISIDKEKYHRVLYNFITNAVKFTHDNGHIQIRYTYIDGIFRFSVKDDGIGIPDDKKDRVFSRFEKLDNFAQGTGLGLSLCKSIMHNLGGEIGFDTMEGKGSTFWGETKIECLKLVEA